MMDIPVELLARVLGFLDLRSLLQCRLVCSIFQGLIDASPNLQYTIELAVAGQKDGGYYPLPVRREMLKRQQQCWNKLQWTSETRLQALHGGLWELYGNVLAQNTEDKSRIYFKQLPSPARNIEERDWVVDVRGFRVRDFGIDPAQDLLIIVEQPHWQQQNDRSYRIHLRTLSAGERHPSARVPTLLHPQVLGDHGSYSIQTCGDVLGILIHCSVIETEVVLWNWKTGELLVNIVSDDIASMSFLGEKYIILGIVAEIAEQTAFEPSLVIVNFTAEPSERQRLDDVKEAFTFSFPPIAESAGAMNVSIRSDPAPIWEPSSVPFFAAPGDRLYVISLLINTRPNLARVAQLFALGTSFLSLIERTTGQNPAHFDWHMWGPEGTRMILPHILPSETWVCYVYGTRYVSARHLRRPWDHYIYIYDFNQLALRNSRDIDMTSARADFAVENAVDDERQLLCVNVTAPDTTVDEDLFEGPVVTKLGYHLKCWPVPGEADTRSVMCAENGIVIVEESEYHIFTV